MSRVYPIERVRNIGIIAHIDAGKTTVTERILFYTGRKHKIGEVHEGDTTTDWMEQERERGITITAAAVTCFWPPPQLDRAKYRNIETCQINIIDTPGHIDFTAEVQRSLRVLDGGIVVFDGVAGVEPQSETVYHQAEKFKVPLIAFVNKLDRMGADFFADLNSIRERLMESAYPMQLPMGTEANFCGVVNLLDRTARVWKDEAGQEIEDVPIPEAMRGAVEEWRAKLVEAIVEHDEGLMNRYLAGQEPGLPELKAALRRAVIASQILPVFCGSALKNKGVQLVLDAVVDYLPSPLDIPAVQGQAIGDAATTLERRAADDQPFAALAFKIAVDPFVGKLCFFRVYSGKLEAGSYVLNATTGSQERVGRIVRLHANQREDVAEVYAGEIAAIVGLKNTFTGHTLCDPAHPIRLESIAFPDPVISQAIEPKTKADQEKMGIALQKLAEEDPTFKIRTDEETLQTIISGMGELHLEIIVDRMKREFNVAATVGKPQVAYKETVTRTAEAEGKYIRQSGGRGQYGHCWLRVASRPRGAGFAYENEIKGGLIPREYLPAIEKGVVEAMSRGVIAGYPVVDVAVAVYDGSYHEVDSSEAAFKIAGSMALQAAVKKAGPVILEPIMKIQVITPEQFMGEVIGNLNSKRAKITRMRDRGKIKVIDGEVPLAQMFGYATELRSLTQGRGSSTMEFHEYQPVPRQVAEELMGEYTVERTKGR